MGIIAGIAIPTTIAVINRQKKNAVLSSAKNVLAAAKTVLMEAQSGETISYVGTATNVTGATYEVKIDDLVTNGELETNPITNSDAVYIGITSDNKFAASAYDWTIKELNVHITVGTNGEWTFAITAAPTE